MSYYEVLAWLPGEYNFLVKDPKEDKTGVWSLKGFTPIAPHTVESAITKHGYRDLRKLKLRSLPAHIRELADHFNSL